MNVDVYPVGLLADLLILGRALRSRRQDMIIWALRRFLRLARYLSLQARHGNWRAVKNTCNGFLAEPSVWPEGLYRCGSGWTRARARRSLQRHVRAGVR